ncbi:hypothetical protein C8J56DRAFT_1030307 [Mycena floridula]|nr:hypothetical protein C8J56DRAFT_1030307 [Mycena floridula]
MTFTQKFSIAVFCALTALTSVSGKADAILYASSDCTGTTHSGSVALSTGVCHLAVIPPQSQGPSPTTSVHAAFVTGIPPGTTAKSIDFFTGGDQEDYGYYSDFNCQNIVFSTSQASGCVLIGTANIHSYMKLR